MSTALRLLDPSPEANPEANRSVDHAVDDVVDHVAANATATQLARAANAARMALHATHQRGQLAAWNQVLDLPEDFTEARDELEHYADTLADQLTAARHQLDPALAALNTTQTATGSWALPVPEQATRGVWAGRDHWITCAMNHCDTARTRTTRPLQCSQTTAEALIRARADFFDACGHNCTASADTIVSRAINRHGANITPSTGRSRLRAINRVLIEHDLLILHARGRHLTSIERLAARTHHGGHQKTAGNVVDANIPAHLMPNQDTEHNDPTPAYAQGLAERLTARNTTQDIDPDTARIIDPDTARDTTRSFAEQSGSHHQTTALSPAQTPARPPIDHTAVSCDDPESSTYTCGYGCLSPCCNHWVAHPRAHTRASTENPSRKNNPTPTSHSRGQRRHRQRGTISLRAWRIADDLTRSHTGNTLESGPYAHLIGELPHQMSLTALARLIDTHTPEWAGTRDVLAALVHSATSQSTGFIALGLRRRPDNATAWMTTVLSRIDWDECEHFPAWSRVAEAYQFHWCGSRRCWKNIG